MPENTPETPNPLSSPDFKEVQSIAAEYIEVISSERFVDDNLDDIKHYLFEAVMEAVYGKGVWEYIRKRLQ